MTNIINLISSICKKLIKTSLELYRWQFDMKEIPALFDNYCVIELLNFANFAIKNFGVHPERVR